MTDNGGLSRRQVKLIVAATLVTLVVIVAMQNWDPVDIKILFVTVKMSRFLLIVTVFAAGAIFGWLTRKRRKG
jgi:uncharacterized integral membrane protein